MYHMPPSRTPTQRMTRSATGIQHQKEQGAAQRKIERIEEMELTRREPSMCRNCPAVARTGCHLCQRCYAKEKVDKADAMVICQGCPQIAQRHFGDIRWEKMDRPLVAWIFRMLEVRVEKGAEDGASKWISVLGWKGFSNVNEARELDGISLQSFAQSMNIMNASGLLIRNPVTLRSLLILLLNTAVIDWHKNEWEVLAGYSITAPEFSPGWCHTKRCTNAAIMYVFCADCIRRKYGVELKTSTINPTGLGLFALKSFKAGQYIVDFAWNIMPDVDGTPQSKILTARYRTTRAIVRAWP
jgi:hypothetical protein